MKNPKNTFDVNALWNLCNEEEWFTCGTQEQYDKMFQANDEGRTLKEIASMIWICSEDVSLEDVIYLLNKIK